MPVRLGHWQSQTSSVCSGMTEQWSDRFTMSGRKTLSPPGPMSCLHGLGLRIWTLFWRREGSAGMDMLHAPMVQPFTYRLRESMGLGGPRWHGSSWQRGIAESGSSRLSTLRIDIPGDLVWDLPCMQQASYLEGAPLMWMLPCTCMLIKNLIMMMLMVRKIKGGECEVGVRGYNTMHQEPIHHMWSVKAKSAKSRKNIYMSENMFNLAKILRTSRHFYHLSDSMLALTLKTPRNLHLKMSSVYVVCLIFLQTFQTYFCIQANSVDPDQTAPRGAVWSGSTLFAKMTFKITSRWQSRRQMLWLVV